MKEKHLYILGGIFVALFIIYFITKPGLESVNYDEIVQTILLGFSQDDVKEIEVYKQTPDGDVKLQLVKQEDQWRMPSYLNAKVRDYSVNQLLDGLLEMTGKVRSSDPRHLDMFQISDTDGIHLILKGDSQSPLANLIIGKKGEDYNTGFVRFSGKDKIYAVDKNILSTIGVTGEIDTLSTFKTKSFVDLNAVKLDKDELNVVGLVSNGKEMIIKKIEIEPESDTDDETDTTAVKPKVMEWVYQKGNTNVRLDQEEVDKFLREVTTIYAQEVVDNTTGSLADLGKMNKYGFNRPSHYVVFIKGAEQQKMNVIFGNQYEKDKGYYLNVQYDGLVYKVAKSRFDNVFKWVNDLPTKLPKDEE